MSDTTSEIRKISPFYIGGSIGLGVALATLSASSITLPIIVGVVGVSALTLYKSASLYLENKNLKLQNQVLKNDDLKAIQKIRTILNPQLKKQTPEDASSVETNSTSVFTKINIKTLGAIAVSMAASIGVLANNRLFTTLQMLPVLGATAVIYNTMVAMNMNSENMDLQKEQHNLKQELYKDIILPVSQLVVIHRVTEVLNQVQAQDIGTLHNSNVSDITPNQTFQYINNNPKLSEILSAASTLADTEGLNSIANDIIRTAKKEITPPPIPVQNTDLNLA